MVTLIALTGLGFITLFIVVIWFLSLINGDILGFIFFTGMLLLIIAAVMPRLMIMGVI